MNRRPLIAHRSAVLRRSPRGAARVSAIPLATSHDDRIVSKAATPADRLKMGLTYLAPDAVSTWAAVSAIRGAAGGPT